jgi:hypothetical protein
MVEVDMKHKLQAKSKHVEPGIEWFMHVHFISLIADSCIMKILEATQCISAPALGMPLSVLFCFAKTGMLNDTTNARMCPAFIPVE